MAKTPLFLSVMTLTYLDMESSKIPSTKDVDEQINHLFDAYIECMFKRSGRSKNRTFSKHDVLRWLSWLAHMMIEHNQVPYLIENMSLSRHEQKQQRLVKVLFETIFGIVGMLFFGSVMLAAGISSKEVVIGSLDGRPVLLLIGLLLGIIVGWGAYFLTELLGLPEEMTDTLTWDWMQAKKGLTNGFLMGIPASFFGILLSIFDPEIGSKSDFFSVLLFGSGYPIGIGLIGMLALGLKGKSVQQTSYPGQKIYLSVKNALFGVLLAGLAGGICGWMAGRLTNRQIEFGIAMGIACSPFGGMYLGGIAVIRHYVLRFVVASTNLLPWYIIPFLDHCVDLIFLRQVGGGYIFVHRLLMEHFAAMYKEEAAP
jgi:hypothetical protein